MLSLGGKKHWNVACDFVFFVSAFCFVPVFLHLLVIAP